MDDTWRCYFNRGELAARAPWEDRDVCSHPAQPAVQVCCSPQVWRYYLLAVRPETSDSGEPCGCRPCASRWPPLSL